MSSGLYDTHMVAPQLSRPLFKVNWTVMDKNINVLLNYFGEYKKEEEITSKIRTWYYSLQENEKSTLDLLNPRVIEWALSGGSVLAEAVGLLVEDLNYWKKVNDLSQTIDLKNKEQIEQQAIQMKNFISDMLSCGDNVGLWYSKILLIIKELSVSPYKEKAEQYHKWFIDVCEKLKK